MAKKGHFEDTLIIYHSEDDGCWIAHSLNTDQIGTGGDIVEAVADALKAVRQVCALAKQDSTVAHLRKAPPEIFEMKKHATRLPGELFEIAHMRAHGKWPEDLKIVATEANTSYAAKIPEESLCPA
jgi:hypothetical protein